MTTPNRAGGAGRAARPVSRRWLKRHGVEFRTRQPSGQAPDRLTDEMSRFLQHWLLDHILDEDMKYRPLFTPQRHA